MGAEHLEFCKALLAMMVAGASYGAPAYGGVYGGYGGYTTGATYSSGATYPAGETIGATDA